MTTEKQSQAQSKEDLEKLRKLLLGEDHSRLNLLDKRISDFESRSSDVAEVLPAAFQRIGNNPVLEAELEAELETPMLRTIRASIKRDASAFAEYLFPVMGPAIRRAVADALTSMVQSINAVMEHSFSIKGMRWRMEATRTGVPFAQVVLSHTMRFAVQETFLIARDTGLVLAHAHRDENLVLDEDAVAAMLTAIQSFIQDSLGMSADDPLRSAELGDRTLWVINGPEAILACIISGTPPRALRDELMALLESIHARYGERFDETGDELQEDIGMRVLMQQSLREEKDKQQAAGTRRKTLIIWTVVIASLIVLAGWKTWQEYQKSEFESRVLDLFKSQPGYVVLSGHRQDSSLLIEGLRDPGAAAPGAVLAAQGLPAQEILFSFKPFWSLDPQLVLQGLRSSVGLADATSLELDNTTLIVSGELHGDQAQRLASLVGVHPLVKALDLSGTTLNEQEAAELARLRASVAQLDGTTFFFASLNELTTESLAVLDTFSRQLQVLLQDSAALGIEVAITLVGHVDGTGTLQQNERVSRKRAKVVHDLLVETGIEPAQLRSELPTWNPGSEDLAQRRVSVSVSIAEENR